jgi:hypothetical protein
VLNASGKIHFAGYSVVSHLQHIAADSMADNDNKTGV